MATIEILVRNKIASQSCPRSPMVCGNSDYIIKFTFDAEWDEFENKIAVFAFKKDGKWENIPVLFDGTEVAAPILRGVTAVYVGCTAGDVRTTTPAAIACLASATDSAGTETPPPEDIWGQILDKLDSIGGAADGTLGITGATVGQVATVVEVDAEGKPQKWTATDMQGGGETVQADFAQNSADAADYIKNRPGGYDVDGQPVPIPAKYIGIADWAKSPDKPTYTAQEVGAATPAMLIVVARQATTLGVSGATVGQMPQVSAVDDDGKPTAWTAVDAPQGADKWELIQTVEFPEGAEEVDALSISTDLDGNPFSLRIARLYYSWPKYTGETTVPTYAFARVNGYNSGANAPYAYTDAFVMPQKTVAVDGVYEVDLTLPDWQTEHKSASWGNPKISDWQGAQKWDDVHQIGGTNMLLFAGCKLWLYGVRK